MRVLKIGLAATAALVLAGAATGAGAAFTATGTYESCLQDGRTECWNLYMQTYDPELNEQYGPCYETFAENCRILYGIP